MIRHMQLPIDYQYDLENKVLTGKIGDSIDLSKEWKKELIISMIKNLDFDELDKYSPVSTDMLHEFLEDKIENIRNYNFDYDPNNNLQLHEQYEKRDTLE